jgi:hypothetical protein
VILLSIYAFEGGARVEHASTTRTQDVPGKLENAEPSGVKEGRDRALFIEPGRCGKIQHVDAAERAIGSVLHQLLNSGDRAGICRLM